MPGMWPEKLKREDDNLSQMSLQVQVPLNQTSIFQRIETDT